MEKIGIVTITYNSSHVIEGFLDSALCQSFRNFVIYIVDNASDDDSVMLANQRNDDRINIISNSSNVGVAKANNQGIHLAIKEGCTQILIMNNDVEFEEHLIEKMIQVQEDQGSSLISPKIKYFDHPEYIWYAGSEFVKTRGFLPIHRGNAQKDIGQFEGVSQVEYAPTCCLLIKKEVFQDVGLMDEKYFVYFDDTDFLYRVLMDGRHKLVYFSHVDFYHKVGSLTKSFEGKYRGDFFIKYNTRNHIYFLKKSGKIYGYIFIIFLFFRNNIKFIFSQNIRKNIRTWLLINRSYFEGIRM